MLPKEFRDEERTVNQDETDRDLQQVVIVPPLQERMHFTVEATERGAPPSYDEAMNPALAPPPPYESVFGRVREVHKDSSDLLDFFKKVIFVLAGTVGCTAAIGASVLIPVGMIAVGSSYFYECPLNPNIPLYLLVGGLFGVLKQFIQFYANVRKTEGEEDIARCSSLQSTCNCFLIAWFWLGSYWVYREYEPNYDPGAGPYCNKTVYLFAFWQITFVYIIFLATTVLLCCLSVYVISFARWQLRDQTQEHESHPIRD